MNTDSTPTMKDVARESGYSLATVSKVINGLPTGKNSRKAVEAAIKKLGYEVNTYARALKTHKTHNIVIIMPSLRHPFFAHLTDALIEALTKIGYTHLLMITNYDHEAEQKSFSMVHANKADGVIALTYNPHLVMDESIPVVAIDRHLGDNVPCVSSDNYRGGELAAKKLIESGCRNLLFLRISSPIPGEPDKRRSGFESYCSTHGVNFHSILLDNEETEEPFFRFLDEHILSGTIEYDGIFCNSDALACRVLNYLREHGIDVPGQVQIIGYGGIIDYFTNEVVCSTIQQPISQIADAAINLLFDFSGNTSGLNICLPVTFVSAGTTKESVSQ